MIIDFHVHAFPDIIKNHREKYFDTEPAFKLLYKSPTQQLVGASKIIEVMDLQEVSLSVIFGFPWKNYDLCRKNNDYIIETVQKHPKRFKGFCCVDPFNPMAAIEVERCLQLGLNGVGELAFYNCSINNDCLVALNPIMNLCRKYNVPVMLHTNEEIGHSYPGKTKITIGHIYELLKCFHDNNIVLAHWGGGIFFFNLLKKEVPNILRNTYYDIAATPFLYNKQIYSVAKELVGSNKIIFGSDFPLLEPKRYLSEISSMDFEKKDIQKMCFENAAKLLKM